MTDSGLLQKMQARDNRMNKLLRDKNKTDEQVFEELFLATLGRFPEAHEVATFKEHRAETKDRSAAFTDVIWALLNTREFILNH
jgi:hypothetical protein